MKKLTVLIFAAAVMLSLCSCTGAGSVEELLSAPALTYDQRGIIDAVESYTKEKTVLKYPASGDSRAPVQFADLDDDGQNEAVVFFSIPSLGVYANVAVLEKAQSGKWEILSVVEGLGDSIEGVSFIKNGHGNKRLLLVDWTNISKTDHQIAVYYYSDNVLSLGFEESCLSIIVYDIDEDGDVEFGYITAGRQYEPFKLKYVENINGSFVEVSEYSLSYDMVGYVKLTGGTLEDGTRAFFIDERLESGVVTSEVVLVRDMQLVRADFAQDIRLRDICERSRTSLCCRSFKENGPIYIPSDISPVEMPAQDNGWVHWYTIEQGVVKHAVSTYVEEGYNLALAMPDKWLGRVYVFKAENEPRLIIVKDIETGKELLRVKVIMVGDETASYLGEGYVLTERAGSYRYYIKPGCTQEELEFIRRNFTIL
ncbi:MAG: hypothetical protein RSD39_01930 [Oscillospiraceae bacterium]